METTVETPAKKTTAREREAVAKAKLIESTKSLLAEVTPNGGKPVVYSILRSVSRSGMKREISFLIMRPGFGRLDPAFPFYLDYTIHQLLGLRRSEHQGVVVQGCGMDMGFHVVNSLERALGLPFNSIRHEWL